MGNANSNIGTTHIRSISARRIIGFFCVFVLIYVPLMVPWPGVAGAYSSLYRIGASFIFELFTPKGAVRFQPLSDVENDIRINFYNPKQAKPNGSNTPVGFINHNSRREGYIYVAFVAALVLASPIRWRRKGWALVWGMILIHGFIVLKLAVWIIYGLNKEPLSLLTLSPFWEGALLLTIYVFVRNLTFGFIVSVFIWILVSFRREDWAKVLPQNPFG